VIIKIVLVVHKLFISLAIPGALWLDIDEEMQDFEVE
jgi:hypothetical protein